MIDLRENFHYINLKRKSYFDELLESTDLNFMEIEILLSLKENPESNTFTDIMKSKDYAKSYVSKAINHLVELKYIEKQATPTNKKLYRLFLCEESYGIIEMHNKCVEEFRKEAFVGVSQEELEIFEKVIRKVANNLK